MKKRIIGMSTLAMFGLAAGAFFATSQHSHAAEQGDENSKIQIGFAIAPVTLNLKGKDRDKVGLGSYLVNAANGCNDCHTWRVDPMDPNGGNNYEPGHNPFLGQTERIYKAGYLGGGRPFGPFASRNITPDKNGRVADGYAAFRDIIRHGTDSEHITPVLQVMPWPVYRNLTESDIQAIYEYLTAIPCVEGTPGENSNNTHRCGN